jgi:hypothetical protein
VRRRTSGRTRALLFSGRGTCSTSGGRRSRIVHAARPTKSRSEAATRVPSARSRPASVSPMIASGLVVFAVTPVLLSAHATDGSIAADDYQKVRPRLMNDHRSKALVPTFVKTCRDTTTRSYAERRGELEKLGLDGPAWTTCETFDDGRALFTAVCELGFEGVIAKSHSTLYRPERSWLGEGEESELPGSRARSHAALVRAAHTSFRCVAARALETHVGGANARRRHQ